MTRALFAAAGIAVGVWATLTVQKHWERIVSDLLSRGDS